MHGMNLAGKTAIVTGAAGGIGAAAARRFAEEGVKVVLIDINAETGGEQAEMLLEAGLEAHFVACDVTSREQIDRALAETEAQFGVPSILFNNAGIVRSADFLEMTEAFFDDVMKCNLTSVFLFSQVVARRLVAERMTGSIVNTGSINYRLTAGASAAYSASKGGISSLTSAMALALADYGIRVNTIAPGTIASDAVMTFLGQMPDAMADFVSRTPLRRLGEPEEIASVACFLASDNASYITGQTIFVDGGRTALGIVMPPRAQ